MDGKRLEHWGVLDLTGLPLAVKEGFVDLLYNNGKSRGLAINFPIYEDACEDKHETAFGNLVKKFGSLPSHNLNVNQGSRTRGPNGARQRR
jgi:hypothetical protein